MNTVLNFFICTLSVLILSLPLKAATYRDKVLSELSDNSSRFPDSIKSDAQMALNYFDFIINNFNGVFANNPEQKKETFIEAKIFFKTGNISCTIEYLDKKTRKKLFDHTIYQRLRLMLENLEKNSKGMDFPINYSKRLPIHFFSLIPLDEITYKDVKTMIAAQIQAEEPCINDVKYIYQSPSVLTSTHNGISVSDDTLVLKEASGNTNPGRFFINFSIEENNVQKEIKETAYNKKDDNSYTLNHDSYILYRSIEPGTSIEILFNNMRKPLEMVVENYTAEKWLSAILENNISEAELRYPESMIINQQELTRKITKKLVSILSENNGYLAKLFLDDGWYDTVITIPLSDYHVRKKYSLELNFHTILDLALKRNTPTVQIPPQKKLNLLKIKLQKPTSIKSSPRISNPAPKFESKTNTHQQPTLPPKVIPAQEIAANAGVPTQREASNLASGPVRNGEIELHIYEYEPKEKNLVESSLTLHIENIPETSSKADLINYLFLFFTAERQKKLLIHGEERCTASPYVTGQIRDKFQDFLYRYIDNSDFKDFLRGADFTDRNNSIINWEHIPDINTNPFLLKTHYFIPRILPVNICKNSINIKDVTIQFCPSKNNLRSQILSTAKPFIIEKIFSIGNDNEEHDITKELEENDLKKIPFRNETNRSCALRVLVTDP